MIDQILFKRMNKKSVGALQHVWDEFLDRNLECKLIGQIISVRSQMDILNSFYEYFYETGIFCDQPITFKKMEITKYL